MIFPGDLRSWKRKHRPPKPGKVQFLGVETEQFFLVTKNLHEIVLPVNHHWAHSPSGLSSCSTRLHCFPVLHCSQETTNWGWWGWSSWLLAAFLVRFLSVWSQVLSFLSHHPSTGQWEGEIILGREGWMVVERTSWSVSALCWDLRLRNKPSVQRDLWWVRFKAKVCILTLLTWMGERKKWLRKPL